MSKAAIKGVAYLKGNPYLQQDRYSMEALEHIEKALTPPTADEVCEELSKDLTQIDETHNVKYDKGKRMFYDSLVSDIYPIANQQMYDTNKVKIHWEFLSPNVLILIGQFYEGLEE